MTGIKAKNSKVSEVMGHLFVIIFFICLSALTLVGTWALCRQLIDWVQGC